MLDLKRRSARTRCTFNVSGGSAGRAVLIVGAGDRYNIINGGSDWDRVGANQCDVRARAFVASSCPCRVLALRVDAISALSIELAGGHLLEVFPDNSSNDEQWRFFSPYEASAHAVFSPW